VRLDGHAIEARLYAENPDAGFLPQTGTLLQVGAGDTVIAGQTLAVIEAMKMEMRVTAGAAGTVAAVRAQAGTQVERRRDTDGTGHRGSPMPANDKAILTCALTGVLTDPQTAPGARYAAQMGASAREAYNAGASIMHVHLRQQEPKGPPAVLGPGGGR
jgi:pyruvate/2-oxoglutarate dehydrogenase complex dihydrolipoamide acyltransferase (E2) component